MFLVSFFVETALITLQKYCVFYTPRLLKSVKRGYIIFVKLYVIYTYVF